MSAKPGKTEKNVLRETDGEARALARRLLREGRHASLAVLEAGSGHPLASRVALATETGGTPVILVSELSAHGPALAADGRSSLLVGEPGKGDPLAHPRMTLVCTAERLERGGISHDRARRRFLNRHPKAALYADFGDFHFFRLKIERIALNGGFGKAYALTPDDILISGMALLENFGAIEAGVLEHMNEDHREAIAHYAARLGGQKSGSGKWRMSGLDPEGMDLISGDQALRIDFPAPLASVEEVRPTLVALARS